MLSDHSAIHCKLRMKKPPLERSEIQYRKLRSIDMEKFTTDLTESNLVQRNHDDLSDLIGVYEKTLQDTLDNHAPLKHRVITLRPSAPWYTHSIGEAKRKRRKLERRWRASRLCINRQMYVEQCQAVNKMLQEAKVSYYSSVISDNVSNQKTLFRTIDKLLHRKPERRYPEASSTLDLVNGFAQFFHNKIVMIRNGLTERSTSLSYTDEEQTMCCTEFDKFRVVTVNTVKDYISTIGRKSCELDPVPASVLRGCENILLPILTNIINLSLQSGYMPAQLKQAMVKPKLKKDSLDPNEYSNFRPISNLKVVSKVIEKAVACQLNDYLTDNHLNETFQSAYKRFHSTETALLKVQDDILRAIDSQKCVALLLLDLSAAFDTVDHTLLIERLSNRFGLKGQVLAWLQSYLQDRTQAIIIDGVKSAVKNTICGVPQGSVLGPILYVLYTAPVADIIRRHGLCFHLYADDTQLYLAFEQTTADQQVSLSCIESCVKEIDSWMLCNKLKLNGDKTELLVLSAHHRPRPSIDHLHVSNECIQPSTSARNIGVIFDQHMSLEKHVASICKACFFHLRNISRIRNCLSKSDTEILVHAFITSKLDSCNSLLYGLPKFLIDRLQNVQNSAARLVTREKKFQHITPILKQLHWLPVNKRIAYKVLLITFKALNGLAPQYVTDMLRLYLPSRSLRSSTKNLLEIPSTNLVKYGQRSFSYAAPKLWNELPDYIRKCKDLTTFKSSLKTFYFKTVFY